MTGKQLANILQGYGEKRIVEWTIDIAVTRLGMRRCDFLKIEFHDGSTLRVPFNDGVNE